MTRRAWTPASWVTTRTSWPGRLNGNGNGDGDAAASTAARSGAVTARLWPATAGDGGRDGATGSGEAGRQLASAAATIGRGAGVAAAGRGAASAGGMLAGIPPSPELLAKVAALPPATDTPDVDQDYARAPDPRFTLRRLLRPVAIALLIGLALDGLDAVAGVAMPWLVRGGIDSGIERHKFIIVAGIAVPGWPSCWPTGSSTTRRPSWSAATASGCCTRCG